MNTTKCNKNMYGQNYYTNNVEGNSSNQFEKLKQSKKSCKRSHEEMVKGNPENHKSTPEIPEKKYVKYEENPKATNHVQQLEQENLNNFAVQQTTANPLLNQYPHYLPNFAVQQTLLNLNLQYFTNYALQSTTPQPFMNLHQQNLHYPTFPQPIVQPCQVQSNQVQLQQPILNNTQLIEKNSNKFIASQCSCKFEDKYILGQKLGQGGQGSVYTGKI